MEDRIKKFMDYKGISASELADSIGVQRSNVTHVLKARNKPSFQFIEKMLQIYPELNADWLMMGRGNMVTSNVKERTLFDQSIVPNVSAPIEPEKTIEVQAAAESRKLEAKEIDTPSQSEKKSETEVIQDQFFNSEKPIERLIVFFKDQTFKVYYPSK